jgi:hypothetical protein
MTTGGGGIDPRLVWVVRRPRWISTNFLSLSNKAACDIVQLSRPLKYGTCLPSIVFLAHQSRDD